MKKLALLFSLSTLFVISCMPKEDTEDTYANVYAGIQIYDTAMTTHTLALDAPEAAFRLGILLAEMEAHSIEMTDGAPQDWSKLPNFKFNYNDVSYNLKEFLFGKDESVTLERDGDEYVVTFGNDKFQYGSGIFDHYSRKGSFIIETNGVSLLETTETDPWRVKVGEEGMAYSGTSSTTTQSDGNVWYEGDGVFGMVTPNYVGSYDATPSIESSWTSLISIEIPKFTALTLAGLEDSSYYITIDPMTGGGSMTGLEMSYKTGKDTNNEATPLLYQPSANALKPITGVELAKLTDKYNELMFPSPLVEIVWSAGVATVNYNDYIYNTGI